MSLNQFLAVGRSFVGIRGEKSPFEMKKDCLLPRFEAAPRFAPRRQDSPGASEAQPEAVQTDWLEEKAAEPKKAEPLKVVFAESRLPETPSSAAAKPARSWWSVVTFGWLGRKPTKAPPLVQAELSLEKVRVIRNDLHDSDLELVPKKGRPQARKAGAAHRSWSTVDEEQPWTRLASRLFEIERR